MHPLEFCYSFWGVANKASRGCPLGRFENSKFLVKNYRHVDSLVIHKNKHENTLNIANFQI